MKKRFIIVSKTVNLVIIDIDAIQSFILQPIFYFTTKLLDFVAVLEKVELLSPKHIVYGYSYISYAEC